MNCTIGDYLEQEYLRTPKFYLQTRIIDFGNGDGDNDDFENWQYEQSSSSESHISEVHKKQGSQKLKYDGGLRRKETSKRITTARSFDSYKKYLFPIKKKTKNG